MTEPRSRYVTVHARELHYMEWGARGQPPLVMWHGLARTGRDFDDIARALAGEWHIIAPDTIGRGLSQWSPAPEREYCYDFYAGLATGLLDALGLGMVDWLGTSMGGAIAIRAGAGPLKGRIRRLILNDIGPEVAEGAIARIRAYAGKPPRFERLSELEAYFRQIYKPYGYLTGEQWRRMTETSARRLPDGGITTHYDPNMVLQFERMPPDNEQWSYWDALECEVLCLRGAHSDLLLPEVAEAMTRRGPRCRLVTIEGCGHAPALNVPEHFALVRDFLKGG
ncbi:MAG TPA: alpha/beta hydrolase [Xanthobacteraceae bacterium]|nr:alpha/beta hydrolase [Xanthobacteraceae bacterium]